MAKYFDLDKEQGSESTNSYVLTIALTLALVVATVVLGFRFLWYVPLSLDHYGDPWADYKTSYTITGTNKTKGYDSKSPTGHAIKALSNEGITELKSIEYVEYLYAVDIGERLPGGRQWGIHKFLVKGYDGNKKSNQYVEVAFLSGYDRMRSDYYSTKIYDTYDAGR
jgi:hypothetical protein